MFVPQRINSIELFIINRTKEQILCTTNISSQGNNEEFEDTKGVIRIRTSKDRQHNGQKKKEKKTNNDLQNITQKTKDRVTQTPLKTGGELRCSRDVAN